MDLSTYKSIDSPILSKINSFPTASKALIAAS